MQLHNVYGVTNLASRQQQLFSSENSSLPTNSTMPLPNLDSQHSQQIQHPQQILQQQCQLIWPQQQQQQQQQPQHSLVDPLAFSNFRLGVDQPNCNLVPHNLAGIGGVVGGKSDGVASYRPQPSVAVTPQGLHWQNAEYGVGKDALWKCDSIGMGQQQFGKFQKTEKQQSRSSGSASEILETQCPNPEEEKLEEQLNSMARYFENRLVAHHERLHQRFMEAIEKIERDRKAREDSWRADEAEKARLQATARAHEQAVALKRDAVIVSYLERITGQKIDLPSRNQQRSSAEWVGESSNNGRWPRGEVEALIRVRTGFETRFQEPGLKGPLWEEISRMMGKIGYRRSAKSCKEKWENINKYFRKAKDGNGKRLKTCSYFDQLNQHYHSNANTNCCSYNNNNDNENNNAESASCGAKDRGENELLEAMLDLKSDDHHQVKQTILEKNEVQEIRVSDEEDNKQSMNNT